MKRDMDLIREILLTFESSQTNRLARKSIVIENYSTDVVNFHIELLKEAGFIDHQIVQPQARDGTPFLARFDMGMRLTMNGYDFLESIKDREVWARTKAGALKIGNAGLGVVWDLAKAYGKQVIKERLGIEL